VQPTESGRGASLFERSGPSRLAVLAGFVGLCLIWGSTYLGIRIAIGTVPPFVMAGARWGLAGVVMYGWARLRGAPRPTLAEWKTAAVIGLLLFLGGQGSTVWAVSRIPSGLTAVLGATMPIWVLLLGWLRPGGRAPGLRLAAGSLVGLGGVVLLAGPWQTGAGSLDLVGVLVASLGPLSVAAGSMYLHEVRLPRSPLIGIGTQMICGGVLLCLMATATGEWSQVSVARVSLPSGLAFLYLTIVGSLVGYSLYAWLLRVRPPAFVSTYGYINPVVALLLGWTLAEETLNPRTFLACVIILGAVVLVTAGRGERDHAPEAQPAATADRDEVGFAPPPARLLGTEALPESE
jgi:drug/metabolite transporter (DMT)-like permease